MPNRVGQRTLQLQNRPAVAGYAAVVGQKEGEGPLADQFDRINEDSLLGEASFERAESALQKMAVGIAVEKLRGRLGHMVKLEVETRTLEEVAEALSCGVEVIMLDNMDCDTMRRAVEMTAGRALLEASGGITAETLRQAAETGVDIISIGALTHSVKAFDISMKITPEK